MTKQLEFNEFRLSLQLQKDYCIVDNENGMFIRGVASSTQLDRDQERMADSAVSAIQKAIESGIILPNGKWSLIPLRTGHKRGWEDILGWIHKAYVDPQSNVWIEAELDETSSVARDLYSKLQRGEVSGKPLMLGLSVGGKIKKASREWNAEVRKNILVIEDVYINEVSVVGYPSNPGTFVEMLTKSFDLNKLQETDEDEEVNKESIMEDEIVQNTQDTETNEQQSNDALIEKMDQLSVKFDTLLDTLTKAFETRAENQAEEEEEVEVQKDTEEQDTTTESVDVGAIVSSAIAEAFSTFKKDAYDPLLTELEELRKNVEELGNASVDNSLSVQRRDAERINPSEELRKVRETTKDPYKILNKAVELSFGARRAAEQQS